MRIALFGGGLRSAVGRTHVSALRLDGLYRIVAGCLSRDLECNKRSAQLYGIAPERCYSSLEGLITGECGSIDALLVLTPTPDHPKAVIPALQAGIPVICEKALAATVEDAERIAGELSSQSGFLAVTYNYTGYPALRELRALIEEGALGRVTHLAMEMPQEGCVRVDRHGKPLALQPWRLRDAEIPTVSLDLGVHLHQIAYYLIRRRPKRVWGAQRRFGRHPVVDFVHAEVTYEDDTLGLFYFGKSMLGHRNGLTIRVFGTEGAVTWVQTEPEVLRLAHADGRIELIDRGQPTLCMGASEWTRFKAGHPAGYIEAFGNLYMDIYKALKEYRKRGAWSNPEVFGIDLALDGLRLWRAVSLSSVRQMPIHL